MDESRGVASTDAGGIALWCLKAFEDLRPDAWDDELGDDTHIRRHIAEGRLVPIFTGFDGAFAVEARVGSPRPALTGREQRYRLVSGRGTYRLRAQHGGGWISGLEHVGADFVPLIGPARANEFFTTDVEAFPRPG